ncbi:MAG: hypothetical protein M3450_01025 [Actinomycetota bacterium]|nr:hypothetical protein [Actinomycetota bacterium]
MGQVAGSTPTGQGSTELILGFGVETGGTVRRTHFDGLLEIHHGFVQQVEVRRRDTEPELDRAEVCDRTGPAHHVTTAVGAEQPVEGGDIVTGIQRGRHCDTERVHEQGRVGGRPPLRSGAERTIDRARLAETTDFGEYPGRGERTYHARGRELRGARLAIPQAVGGEDAGVEADVAAHGRQQSGSDDEGQGVSGRGECVEGLGAEPTSVVEAGLRLGQHGPAPEHLPLCKPAPDLLSTPVHGLQLPGPCRQVAPFEGDVDPPQVPPQLGTCAGGGLVAHGEHALGQRRSLLDAIGPCHGELPRLQGRHQSDSVAAPLRQGERFLAGGPGGLLVAQVVTCVSEPCGDSGSQAGVEGTQWRQRLLTQLPDEQIGPRIRGGLGHQGRLGHEVGAPDSFGDAGCLETRGEAAGNVPRKVQRLSEGQQEVATTQEVELRGADVERHAEPPRRLFVGVPPHGFLTCPFDPPHRPGAVAVHRDNRCRPVPGQVEHVRIEPVGVELLDGLRCSAMEPYPLRRAEPGLDRIADHGMGEAELPRVRGGFKHSCRHRLIYGAEAAGNR